MCEVWRAGSSCACILLSFIANMTHLILVMFLFLNLIVMTLPITIRLVNHKTGEIYATKVLDNFTTSQFEHKEILYRWIDCFLRAIDKGEDMPLLEFYSNKYPSQPDMF